MTWKPPLARSIMIGRIVVASAFFITGLAGAALAQMSSLPSRSSLVANLTSAFGPTAAFSANVRVTAVDASGRETPVATYQYTVSEGNVRIVTTVTSPIDKSQFLTPFQGKLASPAAENPITIFEARTGKIFEVFSRLGAFVETVVAENAATAVKRAPDAPKFVRSETVEGTPCDRYEAVGGSKLGTSPRTTVWRAQAMGGFPIMWEFQRRGSTTRLRFSDVRFGTADPTLFQPPNGLASYGSVEQLLKERAPE